MSPSRRIRFVVAVVVLVSVLPQVTPPALAFTEGASNNFFGTGAGASNTGDNQNSFFGGGAGNRNTTGNNNSFFGNDAGFFNTTGSDNSFFGRGAGAANTTACCNAFFGRNAGPANTGAQNAFFGQAAGFSNTSGHSNAFFGRAAGNGNTTGDGNAFFGLAAGNSNTTGGSNAFFGRNAGFFNTSGVNNTSIGGSAGLSNTTENGNTFIGAASTGVAGITNATAVGRGAQVSQSNSLVLGSVVGENGATNDVNVGIGTSAPKQALHLRRIGVSRFRIENAENGAKWDFQSSSGPGSFVIDRVGGPSALDFELQADGDLVLNGTVTATGFVTSSDRAKKTDLTPADASKLMALLRQLDISTWRFKDEPMGTVNLGPMAQDFHRLFGMGSETTIDIRDLAALALVAAQTQQKEIDELKRAVAERTAR